jgi:hypothetical protein
MSAPHVNSLAERQPHHDAGSDPRKFNREFNFYRN